MARTTFPPKPEATLLCLDLAFANIGYVVFDHGRPIKAGVLVTEKGDKKLQVRVADDQVRRCQEQAASINSIITEYNVKGILAELPGGAQSAAAATALGMAKGIIGAVVALTDIPAEWVTPTDVKKALVGTRTASKSDMMNAAISKYQGDVQNKGNRLSYTLAGESFGVGKFEHIADACGVFKAGELGVLCRLYGRAK